MGALENCTEFQRDEGIFPYGSDLRIAIRCDVEYGDEVNPRRAFIEETRPSDFDDYHQGRRKVEIRVSRLAPGEAEFMRYPVDLQKKFGSKIFLILLGIFLVVFARNTPSHSRQLKDD